MKSTLLFLFLLITFASGAQPDLTALVNPFIGTGGHGHTYPGASMPFGMMQLSPDTRLEGWDGCSGYHYSDDKIYGFSHTHLSGTGIPDYCDILLMPFTGQPKWKNKDYASPFSHANEKASPGYYEVMLDKHDIRAQLTTSLRSGMHLYTFPENTTEGSVLLDLIHRDQVLGAHIEKISDTEIRGWRRSKSWAQNQVVYFYMQFDRPIKRFTQREMSEPDSVLNFSLTSKEIQYAFHFDVKKDNQLKIRIAISGVSMENAKMNLEEEIPNWNFDAVRDEAKRIWNFELGRVHIKGGTPDQQTIFYTALYHSLLSPNIYQDVNGDYRGTDLKVHRAEGFVNHTVFSLWDTYRAFNPLMTILQPRRVNDWINTFLAQYKDGGMLPVWELSANETFCMIGYHSVPVIVDAYQKGIRGFDEKLALEAMRSYAESARFGLKHYASRGYLSNDKEHESVSKTLEYAYDDWCIAQFAKMLGEDETYEQYIRRAQFYKNIYDPSTKHMRGKVQGIWHSPFDPAEVNNFFTEGNSWQYSFAVPHDISGHIQLMGGRDEYYSKLDELFTTRSTLTGREQADVTGLIGQYAHGNEPSHHMAYLFNYLGQPWRTQELVHRICNEFYTNAPDGLIGNEDCGQMSAWYVLSAMGFYPVLPGNGDYVLGTPVFDEVKIRLDNARTFTITANRSSGRSAGSNGNEADEFYVQGVALNGRDHTKTWIRHTDITTGGKLEFTLGSTPEKSWGAKDEDYPISSIAGEQIVPAPYFENANNKIKGQTLVKLESIDPASKIVYTIIEDLDIYDSSGREVWKPYTKPFTIRNSSSIVAAGRKNGRQSGLVIQQFHKVPDDRHITVLSAVHPMYTAGGPDALIDGLKGTTNWRTGEWQSYFDRDFEAVIGFKKSRDIGYVGIHVLQDVSPWILYPKELIIFASDDGKTFVELARVLNNIDQSMENVQTQELGVKLNTRARFIRIRAVNGGKLPGWHESAGNPSHLFIDEVIIR